MDAAGFTGPILSSALRGALLAALFSISTSHAEDAPLAGLLACAKLTDNGERLSCYDRLVTQLNADRHRPPAPVSAPQMFGARPPEAKKSPEAAPPAELKSISARVTALSGGERRAAIVTLDNGQQWQQVGHEDLLLKVGDRVKISRGAFDSFWLMTEGNRLAHFKRIL